MPPHARNRFVIECAQRTAPMCGDTWGSAVRSHDITCRHLRLILSRAAGLIHPWQRTDRQLTKHMCSTPWSRSLVLLIALFACTGCSSKKRTPATVPDSGALDDGGVYRGDGGAEENSDASSPSEDNGGSGGSGGGSSTSVGGRGGQGGQAANPPRCSAYGELCRGGSDCCSGICDAKTMTCSSSSVQCTESGDPCATSTECCSLSCLAGQCSASTCVS